MSLIELSVQHGGSVAAARQRLEHAVRDVCGRFGPMVQRVEWSAERDAVKLVVTGLEVHLRVDAAAVHLRADVPILNRLLASPIVSGMQRILERTFRQLK